eukprot:534902_1
MIPSRHKPLNYPYTPCVTSSLLLHFSITHVDKHKCCTEFVNESVNNRNDHVYSPSAIHYSFHSLPPSPTSFAVCHPLQSLHFFIQRIASILFDRFICTFHLIFSFLHHFNSLFNRAF